MTVRMAVVVSAVVALAMVLAGCSDKTSGSTETLTFTEDDQGSEFHPIGDISQNNIPPGSGFVLNIPLRDSSDDNVGELNAACVATKPSGQELQGTCNGTADVPDGQLAINVGGTVSDTNTTGSITGGTGKYDGATGTFTSSGDKNATDTFDVTLP